MPFNTPSWCRGVHTDVEAHAGIPRSEVVHRSPIVLVKCDVPQQLGTGIEIPFRDNTAGLDAYEKYGIFRIGTCQLAKRKLRIYVLERAFRVNLKPCPSPTASVCHLEISTVGSPYLCV